MRFIRKVKKKKVKSEDYGAYHVLRELKEAQDVNTTMMCLKYLDINGLSSL